MLALGFAAFAAFDVFEIVRPRLQELADHFNAAFSIAGRDGPDMVYLQRCIAQAMVDMNLQRGSRIPIVKCTLGWAYLTALEERARNAMLREIRHADPENRRAVERQVAQAPKTSAESL